MGDSITPQEGPDNPLVLLRRLHRWRMAFFGLVILLAGMLTGAAITLVVVRHLARVRPLPPEVVVARMLEQIGPRLRLSPEQMQQIGPILREHVKRLDQIREQGRDQIVEELRQMNQEVSVVLTDDQQRRWEGYMEGLRGQFRRGLGPRRFAPGAEGRLPPGRGRGPASRGPAKGPPPQGAPPQEN
jgi:hypothetical protein